MAVDVQMNPQNLTGRRKAELEAERAEEQRAAAKRMSLITAQAEERKDEVVDLTKGDTVVDGVKVAERTKKMRVNTTLEHVTIGHGTEYNFEVGQTYKVPESVYTYLDKKGFVWH